MRSINAKKGRDLFDLHESINTIQKLNTKDIIKCFNEYMKHDDKKISRAEFEANLASKIQNKAFTSDMPPLLTNDKKFDVHAAHESILQSLISGLSGDPWKGKKKS